LELALRERRQELLLQLLRAEADDRLRVERADPPDPGDAGERARDLLHEDRLDDRAAALAAELLRDAEAEEACLRHVVPELLRGVGAVVVLLHLELERVLLRALVLDPLADHGAKVLLFLAVAEVQRHRASSSAVRNRPRE